MSHVPVLLHEVLQYLDPKPGAFIIDGTVDGGGHSTEIFKKILPGGKLLGMDLDVNFLETARRRILAGAKTGENLILIRGNYTDIPKALSQRKLPKADGLLLDLGFSSEQLEHSGRGFSFLKNESLLMTYSSETVPVRELLASLSEGELADIIFRLSGERFSRRIARAICERRKIRPIETTVELRKAISGAVPKNYERGRIDPATRTFQALRIYANKELENLGFLLDALPAVLAEGARAVIVSFHSLEERLVKQAFARLAKAGIAELLTKKPVVPAADEGKTNPRSRSAKLRAIRMA